MNVFGRSAAWSTARKAEALGAMAAIGIVALPAIVEPGEGRLRA